MKFLFFFVSYVPSTSSRQLYTTNAGSTLTRLTRSSSHSGVVDEYGEQVLYDRSPNASAAVVYEGNNYNFDEASSRGQALTEEMLLRSHASSGGKFPTHLLTKLGSQIYDMPSDQVDLSNNSRRTTTTTTTRYYSVNQGEGGGYESAGDETGETAPRFTEEKYVQIKASDLKDVLANYDVYSNSGQKLEGEQLNF